MKERGSLRVLLRESEHYLLFIANVATSILRTVRDLACLISISATANVLIYGGDVKRALLWVIIAEFGGIPVLAMDSYFSERYRIESERTLLKKLSGKLEKASLPWLEKTSLGDLVSTTTNDLDKFLSWQTGILPNLIRNIAYVIGGLGYALSQSVTMTIIVFPIIIAITPILLKISQPLKENSRIQQQEAANALTKVQETLIAPEFIKGYSLEEVMDERIDVTLTEREKTERQAAHLLAGNKTIGRLGSFLPSIIAAAIGYLFLMAGKIDIGFLFGFVQMVAQRFGFVIPQISDIFVKSHQASVSAARIVNILQAPEELASATTSPTETIEGDTIYELNNLSFAYPSNPDKKVIDNISLKIKRGESIAIVGSSGSGKSTLLKLLLGMYTPSSGDLKFMGKPVEEWDKNEMRGEIAPIFQQPYLFPFSIRDNIAPTYNHSDEDMLKALIDIGLSDYMDSTEHGLDTIVDQQGSSMSGGQRQRMTIVRAYMKDASVIVLDEPTSALDTVTQAAFQEAFDTIKVGKTSIIVSHNLPAVLGSDIIYLMDNGKIIESGTHDELMAMGKRYRQVFQSQAREGGSVA